MTFQCNFAHFNDLVFQNTTFVDPVIFLKPHPILVKRLGVKFIKSKCLNIQILLKGLLIASLLGDYRQTPMTLRDVNALRNCYQ